MGRYRLMLIAACGWYLAGASFTLGQSEPCRYFELQKLVISDGQWSEKLGVAVAMDGQHIAGGAPERDFATFNDGAVHVFSRLDNGTPDDPTDDSWTFETELNGWDGLGGGVGTSVALRDHRLVAGSPASGDACGGDPVCTSGAAYVFRYNGEEWLPEQKLLASDMAARARFGGSVAIAERWIAVGALPNGRDDPETGAAYVFRLDDNGTPSSTDDSLIEHAKFISPLGDPQDHFGKAVAVSEDHLVVAAPSVPFHVLVQPWDPGRVYVYRRESNGTPADLSDDVWLQQSTLTAADGDAGHNFGQAVAVSGDRIIIGAPEDTSVGLRGGSAYIFRRDDGGTPADGADDSWYQEAKLIASDAEAFDQAGFVVGIHGERAVVGAYGDSNILDVNAGSAYVFRFVGGRWVQDQKLLATDGGFDHEFGYSVATDGTWVVTGADEDDQMAYDAGALYVHLAVEDCNANCAPDDQDIASGVSGDCDGNGVPDECEDCNSNGLADACDIAAGAPDCNGNGLPDECDRDCNGDGIPDDCAATCTDHCECNDFSACTLDYCVEGACSHTPTAYGDVTGNGVANLLDIFCMLDQVAGANGDSTRHLYDIKPCFGDDVVNLSDVFAVLDAIGGFDLCGCGP